MNKTSSWGSMEERLARSRGEEPPPTEGPDPTALRHVWVTDAHGRLPGLLLEWRRRPDWHGRVVRPVPDGAGWVLVEEWLPAGLLDPA